jgi:DNA-binding GntR family transcriptional regulator
MSTSGATEEAVHAVIARVLLRGQLAPGTQFVETRLAHVFGVSRERIRKVLARLGHERLLDLVPNRGAFVASPSLEQAREIYEARRILEGGIAARLAGRMEAAHLKALAAHGRRERRALKAGDRALSIRLSAEFHCLLADCCGSEYIQRQLQELVSRTSMLVAFFESEAASSCACEEHELIVEALREGDARGAMRSMHSHLSLVETRLKPRTAPRLAADPIAVLETAWRAERSRKR